MIVIPNLIVLCQTVSPFISVVISRPWSRDSSALEFILPRARSRSRDLKAHVSVSVSNLKKVLTTALAFRWVSKLTALEPCPLVMRRGWRNGLAVACLTAVREVLGSNHALRAVVFIVKTTVIYSVGHGLCAPFLQWLGQLSLLPSMGR